MILNPVAPVEWNGDSLLAPSFAGRGADVGPAIPNPVAPVEWNGDSLLAPAFRGEGAAMGVPSWDTGADTHRQDPLSRKNTRSKTTPPLCGGAGASRRFVVRGLGQFCAF